MTTLDRILSLVTAVAAVGALYFAWRTVMEARAAAGEERADRLAQRLERVVELVAEIRLANRNANPVLSEMQQDRLRPLVLLLDLDLAKTRELASRRFTSDGYAEDEKLATESLEELRSIAENLR